MKAQLSIETIAAVCHAANREFCAGMGDYSQPTWAEAPEWQRKSAIAGVEFHLAHPEATAAASHESWLEEKRRDGWAYGPLKDPAKKQHPCFVPFEALPPQQQLKDFLFRSIVHAMTALSPEHVEVVGSAA